VSHRQPKDFDEKVELGPIDHASQLRDRSAAGNVDLARRQDRAGIDAAID